MKEFDDYKKLYTTLCSEYVSLESDFLQLQDSFNSLRQKYYKFFAEAFENMNDSQNLK